MKDNQINVMPQKNVSLDVLPIEILHQIASNLEWEDLTNLISSNQELCEKMSGVFGRRKEERRQNILEQMTFVLQEWNTIWDLVNQEVFSNSTEIAPHWPAFSSTFSFRGQPCINWYPLIEGTRIEIQMLEEEMIKLDRF